MDSLDVFDDVVSKLLEAQEHEFIAMRAQRNKLHGVLLVSLSQMHDIVRELERARSGLFGVPLDSIGSMLSEQIDALGAIEVELDVQLKSILGLAGAKQ